MRNILLVCLLLIYNCSFAQDPHFTQLHSNNNFLNPALTGVSANPKLSIGYRNQWQNTYVTNFICYDQRISPKAGNIGVIIMNDAAGYSMFNSSVYLQYAYSLNFKNDFSLRIGTSLGFFQNQVYIRDIDSGNIYPAPKGRFYRTGLIFNSDAGVVLSYKNSLFGGIAVHNINEPNQSVFENSISKLPRRYTFHAGAYLPFQKDNPKSAVIFPYARYEAQSMFGQILIGSNINKGIFTGGISVRHSLRNFDAVNFLAGISIGRFRIGYSYDKTILDISPSLRNSHELTMAFYFGKPRQGTEKGLPYYFRKCGF